MHKRRSCYRLHELSCFLYIFSLPFYFDICCFIAVTFALLCQWPTATEFLKGVVVVSINNCFFWTANDQESVSSSRIILGFQCCKIRPEVERVWRNPAEASSPIDGSPSVSYLYSIYIARLTVAVHKLLSMFSLVISKRKWKLLLCGATQRNHHDQSMGRF
jgi:hypothetical protein